MKSAPDKTVLSKTSCPSIRKQDMENHEYDQTSKNSRVEVSSIVKCDKCPSRHPIGDTSNSTLCHADKHLLEMNSTAKSYRIREAKGAKEKKKNYTKQTIVWLYFYLWITKPGS